MEMGAEQHGREAAVAVAEGTSSPKPQRAAIEAAEPEDAGELDESPALRTPELAESFELSPSNVAKVKESKRGRKKKEITADEEAEDEAMQPKGGRKKKDAPADEGAEGEARESKRGRKKQEAPTDEDIESEVVEEDSLLKEQLITAITKLLAGKDSEDLESIGVRSFKRQLETEMGLAENALDSASCHKQVERVMTSMITNRIALSRPFRWLGDWCVICPNGTKLKTKVLEDGSFSLGGQVYNLDVGSTGTSFTWPDGTLQKVEEQRPHVIKWVTKPDHREFLWRRMRDPAAKEKLAEEARVAEEKKAEAIAAAEKLAAELEVAAAAAAAKAAEEAKAAAKAAEEALRLAEELEAKARADRQAATALIQQRLLRRASDDSLPSGSSSTTTTFKRRKDDIEVRKRKRREILDPAGERIMLIVEAKVPGKTLGAWTVDVTGEVVLSGLTLRWARCMLPHGSQMKAVPDDVSVYGVRSEDKLDLTAKVQDVRSKLPCKGGRLVLTVFWPTVPLPPPPEEKKVKADKEKDGALMPLAAPRTVAMDRRQKRAVMEPVVKAPAEKKENVAAAANRIAPKAPAEKKENIAAAANRIAPKASEKVAESDSGSDSEGEKIDVDAIFAKAMEDIGNFEKPESANKKKAAGSEDAEDEAVFWGSLAPASDVGCGGS